MLFRSMAELEDLEAGKLVQADGQSIAIFNLGGRFYAIENTCPHRGGPLSEGLMAGEEVPDRAWSQTSASSRTAPNFRCVGDCKLDSKCVRGIQDDFAFCFLAPADFAPCPTPCCPFPGVELQLLFRAFSLPMFLHRGD